MILTYVGRRAQSLQGDIEQLAQRMQRLLAALQPSAVVGAAADGADLMVLETALATPDRPAVHVVLPTRREVFVEDSVEPAWRDRFEAVLHEVLRRGGTVRALHREPGGAAYRAANQAIRDTAAGLQADDQRTVLLVISREGEGQMIEDMIERARISGVPTVRLDPSVDVSARPRCFIAMPFGKKMDPQRRIDVDCNLVYAKVLVPALEHAQLNYRRADEQIDSGIALEPMIEWLAQAELVIGDLSTGNFNVGWEVGLRHLLRPGQTLLVGPAGNTAPFDLAVVRHVRYRQDEFGICDDAAIEAWGALAPYLARAGENDVTSDSPVSSVMEVRQWGEVARRTVDHRWEALRQRLALARDLRDSDQMLAVLTDADGLSDEHCRLLRAEVGVGLVRLGGFVDARPLLREVVEADPGVQRPDAHVYYAQSLYRPEGAPTSDLDEAERVLKGLLIRRPGHREVRALLGAVTKRRLGLIEEPAERLAGLRAGLEYYWYDVERDLDRYYEGVNVVALSTALAVRHHDRAAGTLARELLPAVRLAAKLATNRPDERFWALASLAECALHQHLLDGSADLAAVSAAYRTTGEQRPSEGELNSARSQLDFLEHLDLPSGPIAVAREALLDGAGARR